MTRFTRKFGGPAAVAALALAVTGCAGGDAPAKPQRITSASVAIPAAAAQETPLGRALLAEINSRRADAPLSPDNTLTRAAQAHSADMAGRGFMGHHNPEGHGPLERVLAANPEFQGRVAENIGEFQFPPGLNDADKARHMVDRWMNSPSHAAHLRARNYTRTGIGLARQGDKLYATQLFTGP